MHRVDHLEHRRAEPRHFVMLWTFFLFLSGVICIGGAGLLGAIQVDVYRPAAKAMLAIAGVGIAVLWPMVRLSQAAPLNPRAAFALDALVVSLPTQPVIWAQGLPWMAGWPASVSAMISAIFILWAVMVGGVLALYFLRFQRFLPRSAWMLLLVLLAAAGPIAQLSAPASNDTPMLGLLASPVTAIFEAARDRSWTGAAAAVGNQHWGVVVALALPALAVWCLIGARPTQRPSTP
ncbi:MAG: hypothetical protein JSR77_14435 [Planctomycetes bacterium]|nr:hypothetical protein [Planctomycetota bacterium]